MNKPKLLPEQKDLEQRTSEENHGLSREFRKTIDMSVYGYIGLLNQDKKTVELSCLENNGYKPDLRIEDFLKGALYAYLTGKIVRLYCSDNEDSIDRINKETFRVLGKARIRIKTIKYPEQHPPEIIKFPENTG